MMNSIRTGVLLAALALPLSGCGAASLFSSAAASTVATLTGGSEEDEQPEPNPVMVCAAEKSCPVAEATVEDAVRSCIDRLSLPPEPSMRCSQNEGSGTYDAWRACRLEAYAILQAINGCME